MTCQFGVKLGRHKNLKAGFTLTEMLTSIFVIVMITTIFIANYQRGNRSMDLNTTAQKMVADIRSAQNDTLGLVKYGDSFPPGGWAVNFDINAARNNQYIIFADLDEPQTLDANGDYLPASEHFGELNAGEADVSRGARIITFPKNIIIKEILALSRDWGPVAELVNINFVPPDPQTIINDSYRQNEYQAVKIIIQDTNTQETKTVFVNFLGLIELCEDC